jgi:hypothetical protein
MADRKQFFGVTQADPELVQLLQASKGKEVTEQELKEQSISFAYGNALNSETITKDSVRQAAASIRLRG